MIWYDAAASYVPRMLESVSYEVCEYTSFYHKGYVKNGCASLALTTSSYL